MWGQLYNDELSGNDSHILSIVPFPVSSETSPHARVSQERNLNQHVFLLHFSVFALRTHRSPKLW